MSAFSDTLSQFIDDKKIKVYSMAKYCDTDRSTMYKFISGKRNPPSDEISHTGSAHESKLGYNEEIKDESNRPHDHKLMKCGEKNFV